MKHYNRKKHRHNRLRRDMQSEVLRLETNHSSAHIKHPVVDPELPSTKKFSSALVSQVTMGLASLFGLRVIKRKWRGIKSNPAIPTFADMSDETRTRIIHITYSFGSAPSATLCQILGLTARQIGQIRRHHVPTWAALTNQHIRRENYFDRVIFKR